MSFLDFLKSVAAGQQQVGGPAAPVFQRVAQQAIDAQQPTFAGHELRDTPVLGGIPGFVGITRPAVEAANTAGLINEGAQQVAEYGLGTSAAGLGGLNAALRSPAAPAVRAVAQTTPLGGIADALSLLQTVGPHLGA